MRTWTSGIGSGLSEADHRNFCVLYLVGMLVNARFARDVAYYSDAYILAGVYVTAGGVRHVPHVAASDSKR